MTLPTYFPKTSSWKEYRRQLLELELSGAPKEDINFFIRESAKTSFYAYSEYISRESNTLAPLDSDAYDIIGSAFEKVASGEWPVLLISLPPRAGKSTLCSHLISWLLAKDPTTNHILLGYSASAAKASEQRVENIENSSTFKSLFPSYESTGSSLLSVGKGSSICGYGYGGFNDVPGILLLDDYDSYGSKSMNEDALTHALVRRIMKSSIVALGTRKGEDDSFQFLLNQYSIYDPETNPSGAVHLNFSAIVESEEEKQADPLNRDMGKVLSSNPTYHPKNLEHLRKLCGEENFSWTYKGSASNSPIFYCDSVREKLEQVVISVDPALHGTGDKTGVCVSGLVKETGCVYVLEAFDIDAGLGTFSAVLNLLSKLYSTKHIVIERSLHYDALRDFLESKDFIVETVFPRLSRTQKSELLQDMVDTKRLKFDPSVYEDLKNELNNISEQRIPDKLDAVSISCLMGLKP